MELNKNKELFIETKNRMKEIERKSYNKRKEPLTENRIKNLIDVYDYEVKWLIKVDGYSTKKIKELGFENRNDIETKLNQYKMVVIVLHELINTPPHLIPYSKENGEYSFCEYLIELYSKDKTEN